MKTFITPEKFNLIEKEIEVKGGVYLDSVILLETEINSKKYELVLYLNNGNYTDEYIEELEQNGDFETVDVLIKMPPSEGCYLEIYSIKDLNTGEEIIYNNMLSYSEINLFKQCINLIISDRALYKINL